MNLHIKTDGDNGPDLVLLHGWGLHGGVWDGLIDQLALTSRVHNVDLPGHGLSKMPTSPYTLAHLAEMIAAEIPDNSQLLGWSFGGLIALQIAISYPTKINRLALVGSSPQFTRTADWLPAMHPSTLDGFADSLINDYQKTIKTFLALQVMGSSEERKTLRMLQQLFKGNQAPAPEALQEGLGILRNTNLRPLLASITCPVLLLFGQHDTLTPSKVGTAMQALVPDAQMHIFSGAGHAPFLSHPREFLDTLKPFIS